MSPDNGKPGDLPEVKKDHLPGNDSAGQEDPSLAGEGTGAPDQDVEDGEDEGEDRMTLMEHLLELRKRLVRCFLGIVVGFLICYPFAEQMFHILMDPMTEALTKVTEQTAVLPVDFFIKFQQAVTQGLEGTDFPYMDQLPTFFDSLQQSMVKVVMHQGQFIYTYPPEAFFAHVKVGLVAGFFLMSPFLFYQLWGFVAPGLYAHERRWIVPIAVISAVFFVAGGLFGYFIVFPFGYEFFASYTSDMISFTPKLSEYLGFSLRLLIAFGLVFELPIFIFFLARMGLVTHKGLRRNQKYAMLIAFVLAAILTPPDPFTQSLMAGPLIILYEVGIWVAYLFGKRKKKKQDEEAADEDAKSASSAEAGQ
ncbi:MAG: twin-arginine translocase subunit TatC [Desulfovibrio sp.]|jgi:sec-independent protein translocase protein TatC|nr:twin-arginine translocase subunit TatC [Desulfovibrio sp.]